MTTTTAVIEEDGKVMNDPRGAIFQLVRSPDNAPIAMNMDGTYKGNVVADMQIMVADAINEEYLTNTPQLQTLINTLNTTLIEWASSGTSTYEPSYRCNGDSMHHVSKGMTIIRVEDTLGFHISNNIIARVFNLSPPPFDNCFDYHKGASIENAEDETSLQQGANIRGISVAAVMNGRGSNKKGYSVISDNTISNFNSEEAVDIIGIDVQGKSENISIRNNEVNLKVGVGEDVDDEYVSLRLRKYAGEDNNVLVRNNNDFVQEVETMDVLVTEINDCKEKKGNGGGNGNGNGRNGGSSEWNNGSLPGGCPFGYRVKKKTKSIFE